MAYKLVAVHDFVENVEQLQQQKLTSAVKRDYCSDPGNSWLKSRMIEFSPLKYYHLQHSDQLIFKAEERHYQVC